MVPEEQSLKEACEMRQLREVMDKEEEQEEKSRRCTSDFLGMVGSKRRVKVFLEDTEYHYIETR